VVAPALRPQKAGERRTTDRRDARPLARLARSGELTAVSGPQVEEEALRDRTRGRAETLSDRKAAKVRRQAFLLRHASRSTGRATWSPAPLRWRSEVVCPPPAPHIVLQEDVRAGHDHPARLQRRDQERHAHVPAWRLHPVVEALQARRGVPCTVAVTRVAARGDLTRCESPRALRPCLGLVPAAYASGERRQQGAMTTAGHPHARKALVEGAWASRSPAKGSRQRQRRRETPPKMIQASRWQAPGRLCTRSRQLVARGTQAHLVTGAMARALAGCRWAMATQVPGAAYVARTERHCPLNAEGVRRASAEAPPRCGVTLGSVQRLGKDTRAESEAGTRRRPGRWEPTHG
jgi:transposase